MITVTHISDTHMSHQDVDDDLASGGDLLVHTGDFGAVGNFQELAEFNRWLGTLAFEKIINVAGNHDKICADMGYTLAKDMFTNSTYLEDCITEYKGLKIYGTPYSKQFGHWSFMKVESELDKVWAKIPEGIDILLVHGPAYGILDRVPRGGGTLTGSETLRDHILNRIKPKVVCHGHIHCHTGVQIVNGIKFSNAAVLDDNYEYANKPNVFSL